MSMLKSLLGFFGLFLGVFVGQTGFLNMSDDKTPQRHYQH